MPNQPTLKKVNPADQPIVYLMVSSPTLPLSKINEYADTTLAQRLSTMRQRERDVLVRFYLNEQPAADICRDMELTETQFRLLKSRAKARTVSG